MQDGVSGGVDDATLQKLFVSMQQQIRRRLQRLLPNGADIDEVLQETWLRAWDKRGTIRSENPAGFLVRTATNLAIERQRQRGRRPSEVVDSAAILDSLPDEMTPERALISRRELQAVLGAIEALPQLQRRVLELDHEGLSTREVAVRLGLSQMQAWRALKAALLSLRAAREGVKK